MLTIGVKELKEHLSEILREIEKTGQVVAVSNRGTIVARLVPARSERFNKPDPHATISDLDTLAAEISEGIPANVSVEDIINDIRR